MSCVNGNNPVTPPYSQARYVTNPDCVDGEDVPIYVPPFTGNDKDVEILAGQDILVENLSDNDTWRYRVSYNPYIALSVDLAMSVYSGNVLQSMPVLKGKVIDRVALSWSYNKAIASQYVTHQGTDTDVPNTETSYEYSTLSITDNDQFSITGNDGSGQTGGIATDSASITFGNYQIWGDYTSMLNRPSSEINSMIDGLANKGSQVKTSRANQIYATGETNRYFLIIYPASWGEATFKKGIFEGGFFRLKSVNGTLLRTIPDGDSEAPINWTNEEGYTEEVYVYQSLYDNTADDSEPIIIS